MKCTVTLFLKGYTRNWEDATNISMNEKVLNFISKEGLPVSICGTWSCEGQSNE